MYAGVYGSPFPKLNPNVRYKTVFERAGFDTNSANGSNNYNSASGVAQGNKEAGSVQRHEQKHTVVANDQQYNTQEHNTQKYNDQEHYSPEHSSPGHSDSHGYMSHGAPAQLDSGINVNMPTGISAPAPVPAPAPVAAPAPAPAPSSHTSSNFNFENGSNHNDVNDMNPIDRSFFMLTQNDSHSTVSHSQSPVKDMHSQYSQSHSQHSQPRSQHSQARSQHSGSHSSTSSHFKRVLPEHQEEIPHEVPFPAPSPVPELDLAGDLDLGSTGGLADDLNLELRMPEEQSRNTDELNLELNMPGEQSHIADDLNLELNMPGEQSQKRDSLNFEPGQLLSSHVSDTPQDALANPDPYGSDTLMSKNSQVAQLIAELDGVSFSRNEQISQTLNNGTDAASASSAASSRAGSNNGLERTLLGGNGSIDAFSDAKFKKSSAYLSGFPAAPSSRSSNDSNSGLNVDGTPTFYKFRGGQQPFSPIDGNTQVDTIQLDGLPTDTTPELEVAPEPVPVPTAPEVKYPPGEGPCRRCGKDVLEKGVYSKRDNELSGQWHRDCFRCVKCSKKFNKKIPCYILNDQPYCQQHYHEENHSICQVCSKFIEGECLENDNNERFHIHCLRCFICKKIIENDYFIFNDEVPICSDHDLEMLVENGLTDAPASADTDATETEIKRNNTVSKRRTRVISFMG